MSTNYSHTGLNNKNLDILDLNILVKLYSAEGVNVSFFWILFQKQIFQGVLEHIGKKLWSMWHSIVRVDFRECWFANKYAFLDFYITSVMDTQWGLWCPIYLLDII